MNKSSNVVSECNNVAFLHTRNSGLIQTAQNFHGIVGVRVKVWMPLAIYFYSDPWLCNVTHEARQR